MEKFVIGICDDEQSDLEQIQQELYRCMNILGEKDIIVKPYQNGEKLCQDIETQRFHLIFLDLEMPGKGGFDLAERIHRLDSEVTIAFVSNHENMVFESFEYVPMWFVRKSSLERDMFKAIKNYFKLYKKILLHYRTKDGMEQCWILSSDILYIEGSGHNLIIKMVNGEQYQIYGSLKKMEKKISQSGFVRIHKNYLVNANHVKRIGVKTILLSKGIELDIGKNRRKQVIQILDSYHQGRRMG